MAEAKNIILITGASSGIGFATASQLITDPNNHVIMGCRTESGGLNALSKLQAMNAPGSIEMILLDVTDAKTVTAAADKVAEEHGRLDVLINNAGKALSSPGTPPAQEMAECFAVNAIGPELTVEAFGPLMKKSTKTPRIINVSSADGSVSRRFKPHLFTFNASHIQYRASKAAQNMVTANQSVLYGQQGFKVFAVCPGHCLSNLSPATTEDFGAGPASEGAKTIIRIVSGERDDEHGHFLHADGQYTW